MQKYNRVLVKLSGEALAGDKQRGFDHEVITRVVGELKQLVQNGIEVCVVIGGGNFWRGRTSGDMDRTKADQIGMLATIMNAIYVADVCRSEGIESVVQTPFAVGNMTELFSKDSALLHMKQGRIVSDGTPVETINQEMIKHVYQIECDIDNDPISNKPRIHPIQTIKTA